MGTSAAQAEPDKATFTYFMYFQGQAILQNPLTGNISMSAAVRQIRSAGIHGLWVASKISSPENGARHFSRPRRQESRLT